MAANTPSVSFDKMKGMFIGVFLGDALGAPHEFRVNAKTPYTGKLEHIVFNVSRWQGRKEMAIGQFTDDSEMTLSLLRTMIKDKGYDKNNVILAYLNWANSGNWAMGKNTRQIFKGVKTLKGYQNRMDKMIGSGEISQSNGTLMRASPLALLYENNIVMVDAQISNPNNVNIDANLVYVNALRLSLQGNDPTVIFGIIKGIAQTNEVKEVLMQVEKREPRVISDKKGWCLHALWVTFMALTTFNNFTDAMKWIITSQPGSDTDTNAAIAGGLLGALFGFDKINAEPAMNENIKILLSVDTQKGPNPRPDFYSLKDFDSLMSAAYNLTK